MQRSGNFVGGSTSLERVVIKMVDNSPLILTEYIFMSRGPTPSYLFPKLYSVGSLNLFGDKRKVESVVLDVLEPVQ